LSKQQCQHVLENGLCKDFADQCENTCTGCCSNKRNKLSTSQCQGIAASGLCKGSLFVEQCESTCNGCDAPISTTPNITSTTVPATKNEIADVVDAQINLEDAKEDRSAFLTVVLITILASVLCFIIIITAVVCAACCRARKRQLSGLNKQVVQDIRPPTTNTQQINKNNTVVDSRPPDRMPPERMITSSTKASYPDGYMMDNEYNTATECDMDQNGNHVLSLGNLHVPESAIQNDNNTTDRPIRSPVHSDNVSDVQTVIIKSDALPSPPADDEEYSGVESYYPCSSISTLQYGN